AVHRRRADTRKDFAGDRRRAALRDDRGRRAVRGRREVDSHFGHYLLRARGPEADPDRQRRLDAEEDRDGGTARYRASAGDESVSGAVRESRARLERVARVRGSVGLAEAAGRYRKQDAGCRRQGRYRVVTSLWKHTLACKSCQFLPIL